MTSKERWLEHPDQSEVFKRETQMVVIVDVVDFK